MPEGHDRLEGKRGALNPSGHCPKQGTAHTALQGENTVTGKTTQFFMETRW